MHTIIYHCVPLVELIKAYMEHLIQNLEEEVALLGSLVSKNWLRPVLEVSQLQI